MSCNYRISRCVALLWLAFAVFNGYFIFSISAVGIIFKDEDNVATLSSTGNSELAEKIINVRRAIFRSTTTYQGILTECHSIATYKGTDLEKLQDIETHRRLEKEGALINDQGRAYVDIGAAVQEYSDLEDRLKNVSSVNERKELEAHMKQISDDFEKKGYLFDEAKLDEFLKVVTNYLQDGASFMKRCRSNEEGEEDQSFSGLSTTQVDGNAGDSLSKPVGESGSERSQVNPNTEKKEEGINDAPEAIVFSFELENIAKDVTALKELHNVRGLLKEVMETSEDIVMGSTVDASTLKDPKDIIKKRKIDGLRNIIEDIAVADTKYKEMDMIIEGYNNDARTCEDIGEGAAKTKVLEHMKKLKDEFEAGKFQEYILNMLYYQEKCKNYLYRYQHLNDGKEFDEMAGKEPKYKYVTFKHAIKIPGSETVRSQPSDESPAPPLPQGNSSTSNAESQAADSAVGKQTEVNIRGSAINDGKSNFAVKGLLLINVLALCQLIAST
ncbi:putative integral membrane protein [Babesia bovis T2Bo]|uniref:Membrane protein, putative n=1 Tax=Babesia bovis TaxID=5865 RepID=A7ANL3_BABBO|nr:putative integral membrane protein [Babesia bovis T2Bo]EDO08147.1 putative integral membrane protein [Babesia bovis T2Bo]|eukprot:XP_001611715.1 membrane protein [Babesia bovis T2Bo]